MSIQTISPNAIEPERLRTLRLKALKDAPYAFGADYTKESEKPIEYWQDYLVKTNWCFAVDNNIDVGLLAVDKAEADRGSDCWLSSWWIEDKYRGMGITKLMMTRPDKMYLPMYRNLPINQIKS